MPSKLDLTGQTFGKLTVVGFAKPNKHKKSKFLCLCSCGRTKLVLGNSLKAGRTVSCGCLKPVGRKPPTHCKNGHEFTLENTYVYPSGDRACRICLVATRELRLPETRIKWLMVRYGLTPEQYEEKWTAQDGKCAICTKELQRDRTTHVDHDHDTQKVRDLLCANCNYGIGFLQESITIAENAITYLRKHKEPQLAAAS